MHSFTDLSGCVFFDEISSDTSNIAMSLQQLNYAIDEYILLPESEKPNNLVHSLFTKHFLQIPLL